MKKGSENLDEKNRKELLKMMRDFGQPEVEQLLKFAICIEDAKYLNKKLSVQISYESEFRRDLH